MVEQALERKNAKSCCWGLGGEGIGRAGAGGAGAWPGGRRGEQAVPAGGTAEGRAGLSAAGEAAGAQGQAETGMEKVWRASGCSAGEVISVTAGNRGGRDINRGILAVTLYVDHLLLYSYSLQIAPTVSTLCFPSSSVMNASSGSPFPPGSRTCHHLSD